jgi:hypothetical protein
MRSSLVCDVAQCALVVSYPRFGATCIPIFKSQAGQEQPAYLHCVTSQKSEDLRHTCTFLNGRDHSAHAQHKMDTEMGVERIHLVQDKSSGWQGSKHSRIPHFCLLLYSPIQLCTIPTSPKYSSPAKVIMWLSYFREQNGLNGGEYSKVHKQCTYLRELKRGLFHGTSFCSLCILRLFTVHHYYLKLAHHK